MDRRTEDAAPDDLAPWVAAVLDRLARVSGEFDGDMDDDEIRAALRAELADAPRTPTIEELTRGCAIATELMKAELVERQLLEA